jgi:hypothetical protein
VLDEPTSDVDRDIDFGFDTSVDKPCHRRLGRYDVAGA